MNIEWRDIPEGQIFWGKPGELYRRDLALWIREWFV